jgi:uncharacterized membrane protein (UPF0136 family)
MLRSSRVRIDCQGCGQALEAPDGFPEGGEFACGHCGLVLRNVEAARAFRWPGNGPGAPRRGSRGLGFWAGVVGGSIWLPALLAVLGARGQLTVGLAAALAVPYLALVAVLVRRRGGRTPAPWVNEVWVGLGGYFLYLWVLGKAAPSWGQLFDPSRGGSLRALGFIGALWLAVGIAGIARCRRRSARLPRFRGSPPAP